MKGISFNRTVQVDPPPAPPALPKQPPPHEPEEGPQRVFEPLSGPVIGALADHKALIAVVTLICTLAGIGFGYSRPVEYEASATIQVGQVNPNSPGFYGYAQSASSLATAFARSITASEVLGTIQRKLGIPPEKAAAMLAAEPIPQSPAFRIIGSGPTSEAARQLTNVAATAVIAYETKANSGNPQAEKLLDAFRKATVALSRSEAKVDALAREGSAAALVGAEADLKALEVRRNAISSAYKVTLETQAPREGLVSLISGANTASGNRGSHLQLYGLLGFLVGLLLGSGLALAVDRRGGTLRSAVRSGASA
jgi:uncharacterized protein involved in exopolysaccharide biosynthesis